MLINGLGLGMVLGALLAKPSVEYVTVVEQSQDVFDLVADHYVDRRLEIIVADAFDFQPPRGLLYDYVWHDIWDDLCLDNLAGMTRLKRKYARRAQWQGCWGEEPLRQLRSRQRRRTVIGSEGKR